ncbi:hypothetical protein GGTG_13808 [Gaeumannomyces tritici R3-111a-1]|uniref:DUF6594 domain-containing protein n=1 Tax=Gaeumannomyces tritici (strain R3-111a-1) TaxID=644352 RepID=J3PJW7_GAET3|nr:hypothetical protein GGTG_13808 [Gaeumannomyces tritici R3-111a-1]EJT68618.1 hypothetical protein GGTG_13808 [Gaeumannomyces tritici R3-111a-1]
MRTTRPDWVPIASIDRITADSPGRYAGGSHSILCKPQAMRSWEALVEQDRDPNGRPEAKEQMRMLKELQVAIKEYHEALDLQHRISNLARPNKRVVGAYRSWLTKPTRRLGGLPGLFLDDESDLVAIKTPKDHDYLSELLRRHWPAARVESYDGGIFIAVALLVGSITGFLYVDAPLIKALMIAGFTGLFAISLGLIINARRPEVFAATAAYAAVLVVFVSNQDRSDKRGT